MIITHTYLDKCTTIIEGSNANTSLSPVMELCYGNLITRLLIQFDVDKLKSLINDKTYSDTSKLKHILKLYNSADINSYSVNWKYPDPPCTGDRERAISFHIILFLIPEEWDCGRGFDFAPRLDTTNQRNFQIDGASWFYKKTGYKWNTPGIYDVSTLDVEYDKYKQGIESNIIIGDYAFQYGNEQPEFDITETVNKFIDGSLPNYGIGIAFDPSIEYNSRPITQYTSFFSNHTNQVTEPYLETTYNETIEDDRTNFVLGKDNRLYFYASVGGNYTNLDQLPICTLEGSTMPVKQASKGIYYITVPSTMELNENTMYFDEWDYVYNGLSGTIVLYFTTLPSNSYMSFGLPYETEKFPKFKPFVYGIKHNEKIIQGDIRKLNVDCNIEYTSNQQFAVDNLEYRIYHISGNKEIDIYSWNKVNKIYNDNIFYVNTNEMLPSIYHIDVKATYDREVIITHNVLQFEIISNVTTEKL